MVDLPGDESLLIAGIDIWPGSQQDPAPDLLVVEERLQARLGVDHFRLPPDFRDPGPGITRAGQRLPAVRFPRWHYCPRCGSMIFLSLFETGRVRCPAQGTSCRELPERRRPFVIPVRLVAACADGHIEDFPFDRWAHEGRIVDENHRLRYQAAGSSAALSGIRISCSCGSGRTLAGSFDFDEAAGSALSRMGISCSAARPWLGDVSGTSSCSQALRTLQKGASNVYFPHSVSSIYLPLWGEEEEPAIVRALEDPTIWSILTAGLENGTTVQEERCRVVAQMRRLDPERLRDAAQRKLDGTVGVTPQEDESMYRRAEYEAFVAGRGSESVELLVELRDASEYAGPLMSAVRRVGLVRKLRETRALAGFTRIVPGESSEDSRLQRLSRRPTGWLPATVVRGEGIFVQLDQERVARWALDSGYRDRVSGLAAAYNGARRARGLVVREISAEFVLLHTLAHLLIKQLSFDAGYGSASLRERIYCGGDSRDPMAGILIYTASGDSEGTLGGLVRLGEPGRLERVLVEAVASAEWCSSDPVCIESEGQGADSANLAACHACALVSETSCEEGNRLLDRAAIVGTLEATESGFFSAMVR